MQDTWVRSLSWEDPWRKGVATHSGILAWRIPWAEEPDGLQSMGSQRVGHNWVTSVQFSCVQLFATPGTVAHQASLCITNSWSSLKLMLIESVIPSNHLILCRPLLFPPSVFPSIRVFSNESALCIFTGGKSIGASASTSVPPINIQDWFLLGWISCCARTLKSLLQHHSSKASILWHSTSFMVQLSHPYMTTGKTIALADGPLLAK